MPRKQTKMTLKQITDALWNVGIIEARSEALLLAEHFTGRSRARLMCEYDAQLESDALEEAVKKRCERVPLQYILGAWDFMGLTFEVSPDCLVPRADTELLCRLAIERVPENGCLLDLCTGSGCIAVAAAHYRPDITVTAVELYPNALAMAKKNAVRCGVSDRIRFISANVLDSAGILRHLSCEVFDVVVSNPPYVTAGEMEEAMPELSFEPRTALTDGGDGLSFYRAILKHSPVYLAQDGLCALEHGYRQGAAVREIIESAGFCAQTLRDLSDNERVTFFEKKSKIK